MAASQRRWAVLTSADMSVQYLLPVNSPAGR